MKICDMSERGAPNFFCLMQIVVFQLWIHKEQQLCTEKQYWCISVTMFTELYFNWFTEL